MKNCIYILITLVLISCFSTSKEQSILIGHWSNCHRDGSYEEHIFSNGKIYLLNKFTTKSELAIFKYSIAQDSLIGFGLTKNTIQGDTFKLHLNFVSSEQIILSNRLVQYNLVKSSEPFELPPTENLKPWAEQILSGFNRRMDERKCQDVRTEEEKELIDLGEIDDDFEDIINSLSL